MEFYNDYLTTPRANRRLAPAPFVSQVGVHAEDHDLETIDGGRPYPNASASRRSWSPTSVWMCRCNRSWAVVITVSFGRLSAA